MKVVSYVIDGPRLLAFTPDRPLTVTGVQVPAGTIEVGDNGVDATAREAFEETVMRAKVVREVSASESELASYRKDIASEVVLQLELDDEAPGV